MKDLYKVNIEIEDKGEVFNRTEEVATNGIATLKDDLLKQIKKYRTAMGLSRNYRIKNYKAHHVGSVYTIISQGAVLLECVRLGRHRPRSSSALTEFFKEKRNGN